MEILKTGDQDFVVKGKRFTLDLSTDVILNFRTGNNKDPGISINLSNFKNMKMKDIQGIL